MKHGCESGPAKIRVSSVSIRGLNFFGDSADPRNWVSRLLRYQSEFGDEVNFFKPRMPTDETRMWIGPGQNPCFIRVNPWLIFFGEPADPRNWVSRSLRYQTEFGNEVNSSPIHAFWMGEVGRGSNFDPLLASPKIKNNFGGGMGRFFWFPNFIWEPADLRNWVSRVVTKRSLVTRWFFLATDAHGWNTDVNRAQPKSVFHPCQSVA
jgi:hypothetical protein